MTQTLTWQYLAPEDVHQCIRAPSLQAVREALLAADERNRSAVEGSTSAGCVPLLPCSYEELRVIKERVEAEKIQKRRHEERPPSSAQVTRLSSKGGKRVPSPVSNGRASPGRGSREGSRVGTPNPQQQQQAAPLFPTASPTNPSAPDQTVHYLQPHIAKQREIVLSLLFHALQLAKSLDCTPEKVSALIGIVAKTHAESMACHLPMQESYSLFGQLLQLHAVHRPPFSAAIFSVDDAKAINEFMLTSYYRLYKMYQYAFTPRRVATIKGFTISSAVGVEEPPTNLPPQAASVPIKQFESTMADEAATRKAAEDAILAKQAEEDEAEQRRLEEERLREPDVPDGLKAQLDAIRHNVSGLSTSKLSELEAKLSMIEAKIAGTASAPAGPKSPNNGSLSPNNRSRARGASTSKKAGGGNALSGKRR